MPKITTSSLTPKEQNFVLIPEMTLKMNLLFSFIVFLSIY